MDLNFIIFGAIEIIFSIIVAIMTFFIGFKLLSLFTREYDDEKEIKNNNIAVGIISGMFLVCIGIALRIASGPAMATLRNTLAASNVDTLKLIIACCLMLLHLFLGAVIAILSLFFSLFLLTKISPFKDLKAILNNNIAFSIIVSSAMLITILLISDPLLFFLEGFIPKVNLPTP